MNMDRIWVLGAVAAMIVIALAGWFVGISPVVAQAAASDQQVASVTEANTNSEAQLALLKEQYANIGPLQKSLDSLRLSIPEGAAASAFLQELDDLSAAEGVTITAVTIASATVYQAPGAAAASAAATTTTTSTPAPTPTPAATTAPVTTAPSTAGQLVQIPVQITVSGSFDAVRDFIGAVQKGSRLYLATTADINQSGTDANASISGYIFTLQGTSNPSKSSTSTPTPTPTPTPTSTLTPTPTATPTPTLTPTP